MPVCPICGSVNVRRSRRSPTLDFLKRWRGFLRYRCRDCFRTFYQPLSAAERMPEKRAPRREAPFQSKNWRRFLEVFLFLSMLIVFYVVLKFFLYPR